jgi:hypothetical protein
MRSDEKLQGSTAQNSKQGSSFNTQSEGAKFGGLNIET